MNNVMIRTFLTSVIRNLQKNKLYSLINIIGFTIGIASFILIMLFVLYELSYDRYNEKANRIHRLCIRAVIGDTKINQTFSSSRIFREMRERYPEIETGAKFLRWSDVFVKSGAAFFSESSVIFADSTVFDMFSWPLITGTPDKALNRPNTIVLSESTAHRYFGDQDPMGRILELELDDDEVTSFEVTGVFRDIPDNSHIHFDLMASLVSLPDFLAQQSWSANNFITYFLLRPDASADQLAAKFQQYIIDTYGEEQYNSFVQKGNSWELFLQPLTSIHLHSDLNGEFEPNGNIRYIYIFSVVAFFVLIIACINFMNLSTAKSMLRAREVGIKKTVGSSRGKLIRQFLGESMIITCISLVLAILVVILVLPLYGGWLGKELSLNLFSDFRILSGLILFGCIIGIVSGMYPAFFLSAYDPISVLRTKSLNEIRGVGLRTVLVIVQFAASIFLIIGTLVVSRQLRFIQDKDVGFIKENILTINLPPSFHKVSEAFTDRLRQQTAIIGVSESSSLPGRAFSNWGFGAEGVDKWFTLNQIVCDTAYGRTLGMQMVEGRFFSPDFPTDSSGIILNETAVRVLGLEHPLGTKMFDGRKPRNNYHVIGVVKDFNYESIHTEVRPLGLVNLNERTPDILAVRFRPGNKEEVILQVKDAWTELMPGIPISYGFLRDSYDGLYRNELQTKQVFMLLSGLAVVVAVLGLLGLASFMAQKRIREIAIRRISGAGVNQIIGLLTWKFLRWVLVSFVVACPLAWLVMDRWLQHFTYRIPLSAWIFVISGMIALVLVLITVSLITFRAATLNPAESLRYE